MADTINLIRNHNFQAPYQFPPFGEEDVRIVRGLELIPFRSMNLRVPTDFLCFTCDDGNYVTVEMGLGETQERLFNGHTSVKYFCAGHPHDAGLAQTLWLEPGKYQYRAWTHGWSNHNIPVSEEYEYCNNEGLCSSGVGIGPYFELEGTIGGLNGDPWNDAKFNMYFLLGVTMGEFVSPHSNHVIWGKGAHIYNIFHELPLLEFSVVEAGMVTVYVRSITEWMFRNADGYIGELELVRVGDAGDECWGKPRVQYEKTYVLFPPEMSLEDKHRLLDIFPNYTRGPSADDAAMGMLKDRTVIAVDPYKWTDSLQDFFATYYPGTKYEEYILNPETPSDLLLWQCNLEWAFDKLAGWACSSTICETGCWISCCASAQRFLGIDVEATPATVNQALGENGFTGCLTNWSAMKAKLDVEVVKRTDNEYEASLWLDGRKDHCAFAEVEPGPDMHFIFVEKYDDDSGFYCHDPYRNVSDELYNLYPQGAESWRLIRRVEGTPLPPPPPEEPQYPDPGQLISLHSQAGWRGDLEFIRAVKPSVYKLVTAMERAWQVKEASPNTLVVYRPYTKHQSQYIYHEDGPLAGAHAYIDTFADALATNQDVIDYVESVNEEIPTHDLDKLRTLVRFDSAFCVAMQDRFPRITAVILTAAVGNPDHDEVAEMIPAVRTAILYSQALGPHTYWNVHDGESELLKDWLHHAGRPLESWDPIFREAGLYPRYIFGECGAVEDMQPNDGWQAAYNLEKYIDDILLFRAKMTEWNALHGNRVIGATLFTLGGGDVWREFEHGPYLSALAEVLMV